MTATSATPSSRRILEPLSSSAEQFTEFVNAELTKNAALAKEIGLKAE